MKTFILLALLALVATSYGAPAPDSDLAIAEALLDNLDDAELQSLLEAEVQDDDDDDTALIEALLQNEKATAQWGSFFKKAFNVAKKVASNPMVRKIGGSLLKGAARRYGVPVQSQDDDDDDTALIEALTQDDDDDDGDIAMIEALLKDQKATAQWGSFFKKAFNVAKKVASNPMVRKIGGSLLKGAARRYGVPVQSQYDDDDDTALIEALTQDDDDDDGDIAMIEALLKDQKATAQWGSFFKKAFNVAKKVASNPIVRKIGGSLLKGAARRYGVPVQAQDDDDDDTALIEALMQDDDDENSDDNDLALLQALLESEKASAQGWGKKLKSVGKKAWKVGKKVAKNPTVRKVGGSLLKGAARRYGVPVDAQDDDDDDTALIEALMQDNDDDDAALIEALMQDDDDENDGDQDLALLQALLQDENADIESWGKFWSGVKKVAKSPITRGIVKTGLRFIGKKK